MSPDPRLKGSDMNTTPTITDTRIMFRSRYYGKIELTFNENLELTAIREVDRNHDWSPQLIRRANAHRLLNATEQYLWHDFLYRDEGPRDLSAPKKTAFKWAVGRLVRVTINDEPMSRQPLVLPAGARVAVSLSTDLTRSWARKWVIFRGRTTEEVTFN